jgi:hypothetical protein
MFHRHCGSGRLAPIAQAAEQKIKEGRQRVQPRAWTLIENPDILAAVAKSQSGAKG